ncbi:MAG: Ankyrin, partial [Bryobacterales bacterium]|nr:Ankyrin [Bryobacterales bacterium]
FRPGMCDAQAPAETFYQAIRNQDLSTLRRLIKTSEVNSKDEKGAVPLMYAAAYGSLDAMKLLLDAGADPNARNAFDETALMWCAGDPEKVRLLLAHGADVKARSKQGRTPLYLAAAKDGNSEIVKLLLEKDADATVRDATQSTPLAAAALANDLDTARILLASGADGNAKDAVSWTPLMNAAANGNSDMIRMLLKRGADVNAVSAKEINPPVKHGAIQLGLDTPLILAASGSSMEAVRLLLVTGAKVDAQDVRGLTPLALAIATDHPDPQVVRLLLEYGASPKRKDLNGQDPCDWALKFNNPAVLEALHMEPAKPLDSDSASRVAARNPAQAAQLGVSLLQRTTGTFFQEGGCSSCHSHNIGALTLSAARARGMTVNAPAQRGSLKATEMMWAYFAPTLLQRMDPPGGPDMSNYGLLDFASHDVPANRITDAMVHNLLAQQRKEGNWRFPGFARPPMADGDFSRTAFAIRSLIRYAPEGRKPEVDRSIASAAAWLLAADPQTTEDRTTQLLGLKWAGVSESRQERLVDQLLELQRPNGGWAQTPNLAADAYATGQVLFTLHELGISADTPAFRKGIGYLLRTQLEDGSWHVKTRAVALQPYFESGFPHARDQWISSAGTAWATVALTYAAPPEISSASSR